MPRGTLSIDDSEREFMHFLEGLPDAEPNPSRRQFLAFLTKSAGYKLRGTTKFQGLNISIEQRKGDVRRGVDADGKPWETKMLWPYGGIKGTSWKAVDSDLLDCFVGPNPNATTVFVIHQRDPKTGAYDEDKCMLGFDTWEAARDAYLAHYDSQKFLAPKAEDAYTAWSIEDFTRQCKDTNGSPRGRMCKSASSWSSQNKVSRRGHGRKSPKTHMLNPVRPHVVTVHGGPGGAPVIKKKLVGQVGMLDMGLFDEAEVAAVPAAKPKPIIPKKSKATKEEGVGQGALIEAPASPLVRDAYQRRLSGKALRVQQTYHDVGEKIGGVLDHKGMVAMFRQEQTLKALSMLEERDPAWAAAEITKARLLGDTSAARMRGLGMASGAALMVRKLYGSIQPRPPDTPEARALYLEGVLMVREALENCRTSEDVKTLLEAWTDEYGSGFRPMAGDDEAAERQRHCRAVHGGLGRKWVNRSGGARFAFRARAMDAAATLDRTDDWSWTREGQAANKGVRWERIVQEDAYRQGGPEVDFYKPEEYVEKFGMRSVEWGNWMMDELASWHGKRCAEAFVDLADLLKMNLKQISYNGRLAIAFGARGRGRASAHYEPSVKAINLTKWRGGGSLAHEWCHFFDHMVSVVSGGSSLASEAMPAALSPEYRSALRNVLRTITANEHGGRTPYYAACEDKGPYWANPVEMFARCFESWIEDTLEKKKRKNTYLVAGTNADYASLGMFDPYPKGEHRDRINKSFEELWKVVRSEKLLKKAYDILAQDDDTPAPRGRWLLLVKGLKKVPGHPRKTQSGIVNVAPFTARYQDGHILAARGSAGGPPPAPQASLFGDDEEALPEDAAPVLKPKAAPKARKTTPREDLSDIPQEQLVDVPASAPKGVSNYAKRIGANFASMGTSPNQWRAVEITGFAETTNAKGEAVVMPTFDLSSVSDYSPAPSAYAMGPNSSMAMNCELCGHDIQRVFYLANAEKKWLMIVGSECIDSYVMASMPEEDRKRAGIILSLGKKKLNAEHIAMVNDMMTCGVPADEAVAGAQTFHNALTRFERQNPRPTPEQDAGYTRSFEEYQRVIEAKRGGRFLNGNEWELYKNGPQAGDYPAEKLKKWHPRSSGYMTEPPSIVWDKTREQYAWDATMKTAALAAYAAVASGKLDEQLNMMQTHVMDDLDRDRNDRFNHKGSLRDAEPLEGVFFSKFIPTRTDSSVPIKLREKPYGRLYAMMRYSGGDRPDRLDTAPRVPFGDKSALEGPVEYIEHVLRILGMKGRFLLNAEDVKELDGAASLAVYEQQLADWKMATDTEADDA